MQGVIRHEGGQRFQVESEAGQQLILDASTPREVRQGPSPMEAIMLSAGCCSAMDVVDVLTKMKRELHSFTVEVEAERASEYPMVFVSLGLHYSLSGEGLDASSVERAINLSKEKYCSALIMLKRAGVQISTSYEIHPPSID